MLSVEVQLTVFMVTGILRYQIDFQVLSGQVFDELEDDFDLDDY